MDARPDGSAWADEVAALLQVLETQALGITFAPVADLGTASIAGFVAFPHGPAATTLFSTQRLWRLARARGVANTLQRLYIEQAVPRFAAAHLPGKLFLSLAPDLLLLDLSRGENLLIGVCERQQFPLANLVAVFADHAVPHPYSDAVLADGIMRVQGSGVAVATAGLPVANPGDSEERAAMQWLEPDLVIGVAGHGERRELLRGLAAAYDGEVLATGVDAAADLAALKEAGVRYASGPIIGRADVRPTLALAPDVMRLLVRGSAGGEPPRSAPRGSVIETRLLIRLDPVSPTTPISEVFERFERDPSLNAVAVVDAHNPVGLINRHALIDRLARPYHHELYGRRPCTIFMDAEPLVIDKNLTVQELSYLVASSDRRHLSNGFIITDAGRYLGVGTGHDLMREITDLQIQAARYANPLTQLPGNVPINERIDEYLRADVPFVCCYCDLDEFKPFNDVYGFSKGDAVIQFTGRLLAQACDPALDFVGHIGGDDFIVLFRSDDWKGRCERVLNQFDAHVGDFFEPEHRRRGGYITENRQGKREFHALTSLSVGALEVPPGAFGSHKEVARIAADCKKMAKRQPGNSLYTDRRHYPTLLRELSDAH